MLERYGGRDDIAGWQIDNEFGCHETTLSYDTSTLQRFRSWLGDHYESIEGLNDAWSTVFRSREYPGSTRSDFRRPPSLNRIRRIRSRSGALRRMRFGASASARQHVFEPVAGKTSG